MSFVTQFFIKPRKPAPVRLAAGSFTVDGQGQILTSTLPLSFPSADLQAISEAVLTAFQSAEAAAIPVRELLIYYLALKLVARRMRGGAIVFLEPYAQPEHEQPRLQITDSTVPGPGAAVCS